MLNRHESFGEETANADISPAQQPLLPPVQRPLHRGRRLVPSQPDLRNPNVLSCRHSDGFWAERLQGLRKRLTQYGWRDWLAVVLPCSAWLQEYSWRDSLPTDILAGVTVGVMAVPQSMSYAQIAGLPSNYGLYSAFVPVLAYALFGSSRQLAVGPVAITSLLLSNGLQDLIPDSAENVNPNDPVNPAAQTAWNHAAVQVSLLVGASYLALSFLRAGFLTNFLSHSVISGFTSGAAVITALAQVKYLLGLTGAHRSIHVDRTVARIIAHLDEFDWRELAMGAAWLAILLTMKHLGKTRKRWQFMRPLGPLTVTALSTVLVCAVWGVRPGDGSVKVIGKIQHGLPRPTVDWWLPITQWSGMLQVTAIITLVGLMESIAVAKALADRNHYDLDTNQELGGLGFANLAGAAFSAYPAVGSFSRSAVADDAGATSGVAALCTAGAVGLTLAALTPVFRTMPLNALAAIVVSGVIGIFEGDECLFLWRVNKRDWLVWMTSFLGTLFLGVETGLAISIGLALLIVVTESAAPQVAVLGRLPETEVYRNKLQYPEARMIPGVAILRVDAPIYFANVQTIKARLKKFEELIQAAAVHLLMDVVRLYKQRDVVLLLANPSERVMQVLERTTLPDLIGRQHIFVGVHDCVEWAKEQVQEAAVDNLEASHLRRTWSLPARPVTHLGRISSDGS